MKKLFVIFFTISSLSIAQFSFWENYGEMNKPVAGGSIVERDGTDILYILGGYSDIEQSNVDWVQKYTTNDNVIKILGLMSVPRFGLVSINYNNTAYFYGGVYSESTDFNNISSWDFSTLDSTLINTNNINFNRIFSTGHIINNKLYIVGGNPPTGTLPIILPYIVEYDLTDSLITFQLDSLLFTEDLPEQHMSEVIGDDIFIFGGVINGISQDIYKFNTVEKTYEKLPIEMLIPRAGGRAEVGLETNKIYIIGGYNEENKALNSVEIFSAYGDNFFIEEGTPINNARYSFMSAFQNDYIYILGGFNENGSVVSSIERYNESAIVNFEEISETIPESFKLYQNYPNPFNPITTIKYSIPSLIEPNIAFSRINLSIYDVLGNKIKTLFNGQNHTPGNYKVEFDASNLSSGIYFYQLSIISSGDGNSLIQTKKMILAK